MSSAGDKDSGSSAARDAETICTTPVTIAQLAKLSGRSEQDVEQFFVDACGGYDRYVEICKDPVGLALFLNRLIEEVLNHE